MRQVESISDDTDDFHAILRSKIPRSLASIGSELKLRFGADVPLAMELVDHMLQRIQREPEGGMLLMSVTSSAASPFCEAQRAYCRMLTEPVEETPLRTLYCHFGSTPDGAETLTSLLQDLLLRVSEEVRFYREVPFDWYPYHLAAIVGPSLPSDARRAAAQDLLETPHCCLDTHFTKKAVPLRSRAGPVWAGRSGSGRVGSGKSPGQVGPRASPARRAALAPRGSALRAGRTDLGGRYLGRHANRPTQGIYESRARRSAPRRGALPGRVQLVRHRLGGLRRDRSGSSGPVGPIPRGGALDGVEQRDRVSGARRLRWVCSGHGGHSSASLRLPVGGEGGSLASRPPRYYA